MPRLILEAHAITRAYSPGCLGRIWSSPNSTHDSHRAGEGLVTASVWRAVGVPRSAVLSGLARYNSAVPADAHRRGLGRYPAAHDNGGIHRVLRSTRQDAVRWSTLPFVCLSRLGPVGILCQRGHTVR